MLVKERLEKKPNEVVAVKPGTNTIKAMGLMIEKGVRCLPVVDDDGKLLGIVDDKDIFRAIHRDTKGFKDVMVEDLMESDLIVGVPDDDINYIAGLMKKNEIRYVPIMEKERMIGLISRSDVVEVHRRHIEIENRYLQMYMEGAHHQ